MMETLVRLKEHHGPKSKAIVWAHNTHVGDARATDMRGVGMINIGQLVREQYADDGVYIVGFGSYQGTVIAGKEWDAPYEVMDLPPAIPYSWENVLHETFASDQMLNFRKIQDESVLHEPYGHRAVGVVYNPKSEHGNYVPTKLPYRYDSFIHCDTTKALTPYNYEPTKVNQKKQVFMA
jgi:erythromycin esterase-like protein